MAINDIPLVSVIVTTYNRKNLLKNTIDSILNQTYKIFELIVVDNCSDYDFISQIKSFNDERIRLFQNANDGIIAVNRNFGIKQSKGKYIAFCDDDDIWLPKKLEKQTNYIVNSNYGMIFTMQKQFGATSIFSNYFGIGPLPFKKDTSANALLQVNCIPTSSVVIKKDLLDQIDYFDERRSFIAIEDNDLWIRVSKVAAIGFVPNVLVLHRNHRDGTYLNSTTIYGGKKELFKKHGIQYNSSSLNWIKNNLTYYFIRNIFNLLYENIYFNNRN